MVDGQHDLGDVVRGIGRAQWSSGLLVELDDVGDDGTRRDGGWDGDIDDEFSFGQWDVVFSCSYAGCGGQLGEWGEALWTLLGGYGGTVQSVDGDIDESHALSFIV
jgi:hypothetical protein